MFRPAGLGVLASAAVLTASVALPSALAAPPTPNLQSPVEALASYVGQSTCSPTEKPGSAALRTLVLATYRGTGDYGIVRACTVGGTSEHKEGRAWDWKLNAFDPAQDAQAKDLFAWLLATDSAGNTYAMARRLGIMYMIYNGHTWSAYNASAGWRPYTGSNPHTDHVHISLSWPGADKQTSFWGSTAPAAAVTAITAAWTAAGGAAGPLGASAGPVRAVRGGQAQSFQGGQVLWSTATGAHAVYGDIALRYAAEGGPNSVLGLPTTSEGAVRGGRGNTFQGGQVLWSRATGAHAVYGAIANRYAAEGGPDSALGLPTTSEGAVRGGRGNTFQGGQVLWSPATGAHAVTGAALVNYIAQGAADGPLGLPSTEAASANATITQQVFTSGRIYTRGPVARHVRGALLGRYLALGGPAGRLGAPVSDEYSVAGGRRSDFDGGSLVWVAATGAVLTP
jgi:uncharacterized protein with LGFP repeats